MRDQPVDIDAMTSGAAHTVEVVCGPRQDARRSSAIPSLNMSDAHCELCQPLPHPALVIGGVLPRCLEHLVGVERQPSVEQLLRVCERIGRGQVQIVGYARDALASVR
jgi:hypothetical protein